MDRKRRHIHSLQRRIHAVWFMELRGMLRRLVREAATLLPSHKRRYETRWVLCGTADRGDGQRNRSTLWTTSRECNRIDTSSVTEDTLNAVKSELVIFGGGAVVIDACIARLVRFFFKRSSNALTFAWPCKKPSPTGAIAQMCYSFFEPPNERSFINKTVRYF